MEDTTKKRTWSEVNKSRKDERRKWKEVNLEKKMLKEKLKAEKSENECKTLTPKSFSTLSIAVPGSILENAQCPELRTYLAGQIARAACMFQVDEIVVFDDYADEANAKKAKFDNDKVSRQSCVQLGRILQYMECPQYLRRSFFPIHNDLKFCGLINPLNAPHHLRLNDDFIFREGVVLNTPVAAGKGSIVNVGLLKQVRVDKTLQPGLRCTVKLLPPSSSSKKLKGIIVSPNLPRSETGVYWGYSVRIANSLSKVFSQCIYKEGYDLTLGTSDKGTSVDEFKSPKYKHALIMFGGLKGLEAALENDPVLDADDPKLLFDYYLNTLPSQGSKTIRTEEAILVSLATLRSKLEPESRPKDFEEEEKWKVNIIGDEKDVEDEKGDDMSKFDSD